MPSGDGRRKADIWRRCNTRVLRFLHAAPLCWPRSSGLTSFGVTSKLANGGAGAFLWENNLSESHIYKWKRAAAKPAAEAYLAQCPDIDWTVMRPGRLYDSAGPSTYPWDPDAPTQTWTARADLAAAMVAELQDRGHVHQAVAPTTDRR